MPKRQTLIACRSRAEKEAVRTRLRGSVTETLTGYAEFVGDGGREHLACGVPQGAANQDGLIACADGRMYADKEARKAGRAPWAAT